MALTQMQLIQSLGDALAWLERELNWGIPATELRHLCGRIGELYAAMITNGQMATEVNQRGYDVVSARGERISVKTTATITNNGHVLFNTRSLSEVDRIMVLRINTEEMQIEIVLDCPVAEAMALMREESEGGKRALPLARLERKSKPRSEIQSIKEVRFLGYVIRELESGSIEVEKDNSIVSPSKPVLREMAVQLNIPLVNSSGNPMNTRQLGSQIIKNVEYLNASVA
jgi:hypothetical protein